MTSLPSLGPRGEGWVVLHFVLLGAIGYAGWAGADDWSGPAAVVAAVLGVVLMVGGLFLAIRGVRDLGASLTPLPHPRTDADLVEHGVYRHARHPIYGGLIVGSIGWSLASGSIPALGLTVVLGGFFYLKSSREEAWLLGHYPGYAAYRTRTKRFIPGIG